MQNLRRILGRRSNQEVDVASEPRMTMERHSVPADDEKLNAVKVQ